MSESQTTVRLLPWSNPDGNPCFLAGDGSGYVSRVADSIETMQLDVADDLLGHADDMLGDPKVTVRELRFLATELATALRDTRRVAVSRGARLSSSVPGSEGHGSDASAGG
ncbi:hypothetical protein OG754_22900 [Streptomyces decoyicus]|uniref:hypothetical protein n=1 Tax=Streptomyces decoyicus TaxID=249567 RepID=UPI002E350095|nr:hypothetical protein [Streptomyces decoyicus]